MFEDALRKLGDLQRRLEQLDGKHSVSFEELFPSEFMLRNTDFPSIDVMFEASGYQVESTEDLAAIPDAEWDNYIQGRTRFQSWEEMKGAAVQEWAIRRLEVD